MYRYVEEACWGTSPPMFLNWTLMCKKITQIDSMCEWASWKSYTMCEGTTEKRLQKKVIHNTFLSCWDRFSPNTRTEGFYPPLLESSTCSLAVSIHPSIFSNKSIILRTKICGTFRMAAPLIIPSCITISQTNTGYCQVHNCKGKGVRDLQIKFNLSDIDHACNSGKY